MSFDCSLASSVGRWSAGWKRKNEVYAMNFASLYLLLPWVILSISSSSLNNVFNVISVNVFFLCSLLCHLRFSPHSTTPIRIHFMRTLCVCLLLTLLSLYFFFSTSSPLLCNYIITIFYYHFCAHFFFVR